MAIRVASRLPLRLLLSQIRPPPLRKIQYLTKALDHLPRVPSQSPQNSQFAHQASVASLLQKYGFPQSQLHEFLQKNRFLSSYTPLELENSIKVLLSFGFSQKILLSVLISSPRVLNLGFVEEWRLTLSELGLPTASPSLVQKVLEYSGRFQIEPEDFRLNVARMKEDLGFSNETVIRVCHMFPRFLAFGVDGKLRPLFEEFKDLGFVRNEVREVLLENPELLLGMEVGELSRCMELIRSLKCRLPIKEKILSRGQLRAAIDVKLRVDFLCKYGLIRRDAFKVLYVEPRTILYELQDVERKIDFLLHRMGFSIEHLVEFPEYLGANMEKQIIPRYKVIEHLRSKGGLGFEVGLKHLIRLSRQKFYNLFVKPYPDCEDIYGRLAREVARGHRHPAGLWKMFKPEKFQKVKRM
ncbi:transcription termination factor MTERF15, mitochondrial [Iris pallida]|uniref:Transcription termination factor MTERF15, mitochondrial n=1 Tax=Iris pallida TaxID=29817 RepID=A0AAX6GH72_IRIPA|nr:transcription termination factor MTERF15, mitochondrial [Iris pallida]